MGPVLLLCSWLAFGLARFQLASVEVDASVASFAAPSAMFRNQL